MKYLKILLKYTVNGILPVFVIFLFLYQFDISKRFITSYNHKKQLPDYFSNLRLNGMRGLKIFGDLETYGNVPKDSILKFYDDIHGLKVGGIDSFKQELDDSIFSIAFSSNGNYGTINFYNQNEKTYYQVEIITNCENY